VVSAEGTKRLTGKELQRLGKIYEDVQETTNTALSKQMANFKLNGDDKAS
jgi:hypothetical protein